MRLSENEILQVNRHKQGTTSLRQAFELCGHTDEEAWFVLCKRVYDWDRVVLDEYEIPPEILVLVPAEVARQYQALPVSRQGATLTVVTAEPDTEATLFATVDIEFLTGYNVKNVLDSVEAIRRALDKYYPLAVEDTPATLRSHVEEVDPAEETGSGFNLDESRGWPRDFEATPVARVKMNKERRRMDRLLGLLVSHGFITKSELDMVMKFVSNPGWILGELVKMRLITPYQATRLAQKVGLIPADEVPDTEGGVIWDGVPSSPSLVSRSQKMIASCLFSYAEFCHAWELAKNEWRLLPGALLTLGYVTGAQLRRHLRW